MPVDRIIVNASPLILLCNSNLSFVLPELFAHIVIPEAVWKEILNSPSVDKAAQMIREVGWLKKVSVKVVEEVVRWDLGDGETEILSFAFTSRDYTPVLDDSAAKKCALALSIQTLGTGSILILAKEKGIIDSVEQSLIKLRNSGMWISDSMIRTLKNEQGNETNLTAFIQPSR